MFYCFRKNSRTCVGVSRMRERLGILSGREENDSLVSLIESENLRQVKIIVITSSFIFVSSREESNFWGGKTLPFSISRKLKFYEFCSRVGTRLIEK